MSELAAQVQHLKGQLASLTSYFKDSEVQWAKDRQAVEREREHYKELALGTESAREIAKRQAAEIVRLQRLVEVMKTQMREMDGRMMTVEKLEARIAQLEAEEPRVVEVETVREVHVPTPDSALEAAVRRLWAAVEGDHAEIAATMSLAHAVVAVADGYQAALAAARAEGAREADGLRERVRELEERGPVVEVREVEKEVIREVRVLVPAPAAPAAPAAAAAAPAAAPDRHAAMYRQLRNFSEMQESELEELRHEAETQREVNAYLAGEFERQAKRAVARHGKVLPDLDRALSYQFVRDLGHVKRLLAGTAAAGLRRTGEMGRSGGVTRLPPV